MASPDTPLSLVNNPLVFGVFNVYSPRQVPTNQHQILTESALPLETETGLDLLIE